MSRAHWVFDTETTPEIQAMRATVADAIVAILDEQIRTKHPDTREPWWPGRNAFQRAYAARISAGHIANRRVRELHAGLCDPRGERPKARRWIPAAGESPAPASSLHHN